MSSAPDRRSFITRLATLAGVAAVDRSVASGQTPGKPHTKWDLSWLDEIKAKHRQVYDYGSLDISNDPLALRFVHHYLEAHKDVSGLVFPDVTAVVGTMFLAFPINASDGLWAKYKLGERWKIVDPATKEPAVRNIYLSDRPASPGVKTLQARGTIFWQCNVALGRVVMTLSQATGTPPLTVREDLIAGLNPGVRLVPSHVMAVGLAQERGFTYMKP